MRNTIPKPKDILKMIDLSDSGYDDLYPGYSKDSDGLDTYFESKWQADEWAEMVHAIFVGLKSQKVIPVYRTVWLEGNIENLNREFLGSCWSWEKSAALHFGRSNRCDYLLSGTVKPAAVDWHGSVGQYIFFSQYMSDEDEFELVIPSEQVDNLIVEKI